MTSPFARRDEAPQKTGRRFERFWSKVFGVEPQKGSGNLWYAKLDVPDGGAILWSCKFTEADSYRVSRDDIREAETAARGQGSSGEMIPGYATAISGGEVFVTLRADDFLRLFTDQVRYITPSRGEQKRARAKVPALLRDEDE